MSSPGVDEIRAKSNADVLESLIAAEQGLEDRREQQAERLRLLWNHRRFLFRASAIGLIASALLAFSIPKSYTATTQLMPPDTQSAPGAAMIAALASKAGNGLGGVAGDLLGVKSSGGLFIGVLRSETTQDQLIQEFDLTKVYGMRLVEDARAKLDESTVISEDQKSGIITIHVTDRNPQRATALANGYVKLLNSLVVDLSTSSAHRERVFLEERLKVVKQDLDDASNQLAQFSSKNNTLDMEQQGKATLDAAAALAGQMIAAQSELEGLKQIYTDEFPRVRSLTARVAELRKELDKLRGANSDPGVTPGTPADSSGALPYPSIRTLPLLGVKFAEYYRRAKTQETVYELLTGQYELAKVEEAKETPSVKVLDPAKIPQKKSAPPRLLILLLGTFFVSALSVVWVFSTTSWQTTEPRDPRKVFVREVLARIDAKMPWTQNGNGSRSRAQRIWSRLSTRRPSRNGLNVG